MSPQTLKTAKQMDANGARRSPSSAFMGNKVDDTVNKLPKPPLTPLLTLAARLWVPDPHCHCAVGACPPPSPLAREL